MPPKNSSPSKNNLLFHPGCIFLLFCPHWTMTSSLHLSKDRFGRWAQSGVTRGCFSTWRKIQLLKSPSSPLSVLRLSLKSPRMQLMLESLKQLISQPNAVRSTAQIGNMGYGTSFRTLKDNKQGILFKRECFSITRWHLNLLPSQTWKFARHLSKIKLDTRRFALSGERSHIAGIKVVDWASQFIMHAQWQCA